MQPTNHNHSPLTRSIATVDEIPDLVTAVVAVVMVSCSPLEIPICLSFVIYSIFTLFCSISTFTFIIAATTGNPTTGNRPANRTGKSRNQNSSRSRAKKLRASLGESCVYVSTQFGRLPVVVECKSSYFLICNY